MSVKGSTSPHTANQPTTEFLPRGHWAFRETGTPFSLLSRLEPFVSAILIRRDSRLTSEFPFPPSTPSFDRRRHEGIQVIRIATAAGSLALALAIASCSFQAMVAIELGVFESADSAGREFDRAEKATLDLGLRPRLLKNLTTGKPTLRQDDSGWVASYFDDPVAPPRPPDAWFVEVIMMRSDRSLQIRLIQPGPSTPSPRTVARASEILELVKSTFPQARLKPRSE